LFVGKAHRQLPRRQFRNIQREVDDLAADIVRNPIPDTIWSRTVVSQRLGPTRTVSFIPAVKGARDAELGVIAAWRTIDKALGKKHRLTILRV
jgi:hypothetical protein